MNSTRQPPAAGEAAHTPDAIASAILTDVFDVCIPREGETSRGLHSKVKGHLLSLCGSHVVNAQHAPNPPRYWIDDDGCLARGHGDEYRTIGELFGCDEAEKESIVEALNSHHASQAKIAALVAALENAVTFIGLKHVWNDQAYKKPDGSRFWFDARKATAALGAANE